MPLDNTGGEQRRSRRRNERPRSDNDEVRDLRRVIRIMPGRLDQIAGDAEAAIVDAGLPVFRRGFELVRPVTREAAASNGRMTIAAGLRSITAPALLDIFCQAARFERFDGRREDWVTANPPDQIAAVHLSRAGLWRHPSIAGVVTTPTMRPDGSLVIEPGYDPSTRLFLLPDPVLRLPAIPDRPTRSDAAAALDMLQHLISGFPFVADTDRAGAVCISNEREARDEVLQHIERRRGIGSGWPIRDCGKPQHRIGQQKQPRGRVIAGLDHQRPIRTHCRRRDHARDRRMPPEPGAGQMHRRDLIRRVCRDPVFAATVETLETRGLAEDVQERRGRDAAETGGDRHATV